MRRPLIAIGVLLLLIELVRRLGSTAACYVDLRYSPFLLDETRAELKRECRDRHLFFPFGF